MSRPAPRGGRMPADPRASSHVVRCRGRAKPPTWGPVRTYRRPSPSTSQTVRARPVRPVPPAPPVPRVGTPRSCAPQLGPVSAWSLGTQVEDHKLADLGVGVRAQEADQELGWHQPQGETGVAHTASFPSSWMNKSCSDGMAARMVPQAGWDATSEVCSSIVTFSTLKYGVSSYPASYPHASLSAALTSRTSCP